ncbi:MAG TPA: site-specific DNA-methyltransferase [Firmicutes bacterium]|nr:site-specific DNA-methyltransferase [Candidatus Fermentithermobacillaceae bacterium]
MTKEKRFFQTLKDLFIGVPVEGESGYINLMRIKAGYFEQVMRPKLQEEINKALELFPNFREELFEKLYTFFKRYFTESGSLGFFFTPYHQSVYEQVYTDDRDLMLFWKTSRLYYVKTDRLFQNMAFDLDGFKWHFDVSNLEHKKANEKRELVFDFKERRSDGAFVFTVTYSERGRTTCLDEIRRAIKQALGLKTYTEAVPSEQTLEHAFRLFERQSEVDYFICKDAKSFLREQFDLWLWQYLLGKPGEEPQTQWTEMRLKELQALKRIAYRVIDFIAAFEDELVRIWNKPKFVLRSNYVITLDHIYDRRPELLERITEHPAFTEQVKEWQDLGMVDGSFSVEALWETDLMGRRLHSRYRFLPLDTRYFKDLELEILGLFDNLDEALDGWLIKSENYQALNTLLPKFRERVKCVHIDPPYNTDTSGFLYANRYRHASWLTMMENRIALAMALLESEGHFLCHIDDNEYSRLQIMLDKFGIQDAGTVIWDKRNPMTAGRGVALQHEYVIWRSNVGTPIYERNRAILSMLRAAEEIIEKCGGVTEEAKKEFSSWVQKNPNLTGGLKAYRYLDEQGRIYQTVSLRAPEPRTDPKFFQPLIHPVTGKPCPVPPNGFSRTPETLRAMVERGEIVFGPDETTQPRQKRFLTTESQLQLRSIIVDAKRGKADTDALGLETFPYSHPVSLYEELTAATTSTGEGLILDFFAGSGTTAHAVINLNREDGGRRKYILVEMADYFHTVLLPRIKKVVFSDKWRDGKAQPDGKGISHFVKYFCLEQYEDALRRTHYLEDDLFTPPAYEDLCQYVFLRDPKMLEALEVDLEQGTVKVDLSRLYEDVDLAETLSNLTGKWIKRIYPDPEDPTRPGTVEFADGTTADLKKPDWRLIKPLIWW